MLEGTTTLLAVGTAAGGAIPVKPFVIKAILKQKLVMGGIGQLMCTERAEKKPVRGEQLW